ncbi:hypothetical protein [Psychrobacter sp. DAB_AL62B]|uniref:hypothetical protein n=1 Tax=Psychrobacter sp. DAB_AL62B TaxID=1028420 RepID=UPI002380FFBD|nr:hypothetical protein [Psychrobacter sp. DAB_AL62B]MDE4455850.1 hypothetical protein [Psychrobacter sp. DAB_AL62B]
MIAPLLIENYLYWPHYLNSGFIVTATIVLEAAFSAQTLSVFAIFLLSEIVSTLNNRSRGLKTMITDNYQKIVTNIVTNKE